MKRQLSAILALLMLLTLLAGCDGTVQNPSGESGTNRAEGTSDSAAPDPADSEADASGSTDPGTVAPDPVATAPGEPGPAPQAPVLPDSTTAGGFRVWTDPSVYTPYTPDRGKYTRLSDGILDRFEPSEDYGRVYPYVARQLVGAEKNGYEWSAGYLYGFMDRDGRILTDGLYVQAGPLRYMDYAYGEAVNLPLWMVSQVPEADKVYDESGEYFWVEGEQRYGVIAMDGSFALDCKYVGLQSFPDRFCAVERWEEPLFTVYDFSGQPMITGRELFAGEEFDPEADWWNLAYGEGLYLTAHYRGNGENACWFRDETGAKVLGPYADAGAFHDGLACVSTDGEFYGYIDKTGAWVIDPIYWSNVDFHNRLARQYDTNGENVLLDLTGKELLRSDQWIQELGQSYLLPSEDGTETVVLGPDGQETLRLPGDWSFLDEETLSQYLPETEEQRLYSLIPGRGELELDLDVSQGQLVRALVPVEGRLEQGYYFWSYYQEEASPRFVPYDLSGVQELPPVTGRKSQVMGDYFDSTDLTTGEVWSFFWQGNGWLATTLEGKTRFVPTDQYVEMIDGLARVVTDRACLFYDEGGELLFSYPLDFED